MNKMYVLVASTYGDDLIPSQNRVIAASADRSRLEKFRDQRKAEREQWLNENQLVIAGTIRFEEIEEVEAL